MKKSLHGKTVKNMPTGTKIVTYSCLAWALIVSLVPLVWLGLSSLKKDPMARPASHVSKWPVSLRGHRS